VSLDGTERQLGEWKFYGASRIVLIYRIDWIIDCH
jgi:hypothetical protein